MATKHVNSTSVTVEIHPYVKGRLRALPRQDETAGLLLGTSENGVTHVTGFKRVTPGGLRQAASDAGPALAGFYRLQTTNAPTLLPEEEELWRQFHPEDRSVFLLVKAVSGGVEATAWIRENSGPPVMEDVSLDGEFTERRKADPPPTPREPMSWPAVSWRVLVFATVALAAVMSVFLLRPDKPVPLLSLDLQSGGNELTAGWEQQGAPAQKLQFATMSILDGAKERTMDLTRSYTSRGRITVRPASPDVIVTLRVQYANMPLLSRSATYVGFDPSPPPVTPPPTPAVVPIPAPVVPDAEIPALRKRNRELEKDVAALRKRMTASKTVPDNPDVLNLNTEIASLRKRNRELEHSVAVMREQVTLSKAGTENSGGLNVENDALRKRNKELEEAVSALRKHMAPQVPGPVKPQVPGPVKKARFLGFFKR